MFISNCHNNQKTRGKTGVGGNAIEEGDIERGGKGLRVGGEDGFWVMDGMYCIGMDWGKSWWMDNRWIF
jgi:hypothetical protein